MKYFNVPVYEIQKIRACFSFLVKDNCRKESKYSMLVNTQISFEYSFFIR